MDFPPGRSENAFDQLLHGVTQLSSGGFESRYWQIGLPAPSNSGNHVTTPVLPPASRTGVSGFT
jgi:hypothetical protein